LKIAILGCRGIPAKYGGFETFAQGLTENLVEEGYEVTVSCEYEATDLRDDSYKGAKLEYFPIKPPNNYFLRKFYENLADIYFLIKLSRGNNLIYFLGIEVGMFFFIPKILNRNSKILVNVDGVMWRRSKFNLLERWLLKINHDLGIRFADKVIIDSEEMKNYVHDKYRDKTVYISYGINNPDRILWNNAFTQHLKKLTSTEITPGNYYLVVARLEPENNINTIVEAFIQAKLGIPLLIVGDFTCEQYKEEINSIVRNYHDSYVFFLGSIYDQELLNMLRQNCTAYIHGHSVGGTNPSLLEASISRNIIIAHDNKFNREVCGKSAVYFKNINELTRNLNLVYRYPENYHNLKEEVHCRVVNDYSWEKITKSYVSLLNQLQNEGDEEFVKNYKKRKHVFQEFSTNYTINKNSTYKRDNWGKE
jgi:rhamnosyltransferase